MSKEFAAGRLDIPSLTKAGAVLAGRDPVSGFPRLRGEASGSIEGRAIEWQARGELREGPASSEQNWLHLKAQVVFPLTCQRCLGPVDMTLMVNRSFRFVSTEAQAEAEDEATEEDLLVLERHFDLPGLIEDEFLMALPVVPRHEICPTEVRLATQDPDFDRASGRQSNPFAVLAKWQTGKSS